MRTEKDLRTELEGAGPGVTPPVPDLEWLIGRGRRARLRRRLVVGTAGVAVIAIAAAPAIWLTSRGPDAGDAPVLGSPASSPSAQVTEQPKPLPSKAQPGGDPNCSVYWVCKDPAAKPVTKPLAGEAVRIGQNVAGRPVVLFGTRGSIDGEGPQNHVYVYAGWLDKSGRPVAGGQILGTDSVTANLEPIPMYRNDTGPAWAIAGQLKGTASKVTAVLPDGQRVNVRHRTGKVVPGYTHFWAGGRAPMPVRIEAVTPAGTVKCTVDRCSGVG